MIIQALMMSRNELKYSSVSLTMDLVKQRSSVVQELILVNAVFRNAKE